MDYSVAVEGGASHTRAGLYDETGALLAEAEGGPANPVAYGIDACARVLAPLIRQVLGKRPADGCRVFAALAGAADADIQTAMASALGHLLAPKSVLVTSDLHALLYANAGEGTGILVIAGTGAAVLGKTLSGHPLRAGGWGTLFGDEGSAYALAVAGLRACARAIDRVGLETTLTELLPQAAGLAKFTDFVGWSTRAVKRDIAALAPALSAAAEAGDIAARSCIEEEARRLAALAAATIERLGLEPETRLFEYGALLENCALFREAFRAAVGMYTEVQHLPCTCRAHAAAATLARLAHTPPWASAWQPGATRRPPLLSPTEQAACDVFLDELSTPELVRRMHQADVAATTAVGAAGASIAEAVDHGARSIRRGGRIIYAGAGTSGRLGALDAAECPPTFGVSPDRVVALIAGGDRALRASVEGAEDDAAQGARDIEALAVSVADFVVGIAASGGTPYVGGVLAAARQRGATTALVTSNPRASFEVDVLIAADTGMEVLTGSTRLKAGTAAKLILNTISTGAMTQAGYVYRGRMVAMIPANTKLRERAARIVSELTGSDMDGARRLLEAADYHISTAVLMEQRQLSRDAAARLLEAHGGRLGDALRNET